MSRMNEVRDLDPVFKLFNHFILYDHMFSTTFSVLEIFHELDLNPERKIPEPNVCSVICTSNTTDMLCLYRIQFKTHMDIRNGLRFIFGILICLNTYHLRTKKKKWSK